MYSTCSKHLNKCLKKKFLSLYMYILIVEILTLNFFFTCPKENNIFIILKSLPEVPEYAEMRHKITLT